MSHGIGRTESARHVACNKTASQGARLAAQQADSPKPWRGSLALTLSKVKWLTGKSIPFDHRQKRSRPGQPFACHLACTKTASQGARTRASLSARLPPLPLL
ncbi:MAG: hypothetical protein WBA20_13355, partial [Ketobacter sp.]